MYHTCAYTGSIALTTTNQPVNALADSVFKIGSANGFVLQEDMMLLGAHARGVGMANPKLLSPKLSQFSPLFIVPFDVTLAASNPDIAALWPYRAFTFRNQEEVTALSDNTNAGAQQQVIVAHFSNGIEQVPAGEEIVLAATSTTAAVANTWTLLAFNLTQALPEGVYAMIGSEVQSANAIAHRFTFWGQFYRPGFVSTTAFSNRQLESIRWMTFGLMGRFSNVTLPNVEVLCSAADAAHALRFRCIKVA